MKLKLKLVFTIVMLLPLFSCKEQTETPSKETVIPPNTEASDTPKSIECFSYANTDDTIFLSIRNKEGSFVEGELVYSLKEKDRNRGNIYGEWKGDSLFADYEFTSEGKTSVREVFFLKTDSGMIEGYAPVAQVNNKNVFSHHKFSLNNEKILKRTDCR